MKARTARLFTVLMVVAALFFAVPAWAAPKKAAAAHGGGAPAAAALKDQNRVQDQVQVEDQDRVREQDEEKDQVEERVPKKDQNRMEEKVQTRSENEVQLRTQIQDQAGATVPKATLQPRRGGPKIFVNGQLLKDALPPVVKEGTTLVPLRALAASLKAQVTYDAATKTVTMVKEGVTIELNLTSGTVTLKDQLGGEKSVSLPVPPQVIEGYTFVPLRFIAETFAASVYYDPTTQIITIQEPGVSAPTEGSAQLVEEATQPAEETVQPTEETAPQAGEAVQPPEAVSPMEEPLPLATTPQP
ncbi:MAG: hypothetical protein PWQ41_1265 [Bacillota bacterium]|nr:hypothetical protein [Bacillota bacterium]MDK2925491.1 hypothetical protein [Bacillota bacterium]